MASRYPRQPVRVASSSHRTGPSWSVANTLLVSETASAIIPRERERESALTPAVDRQLLVALPEDIAWVFFAIGWEDTAREVQAVPPGLLVVDVCAQQHEQGFFRRLASRRQSQKQALFQKSRK